MKEMMHTEFGLKGEEVACNLLVSKGYQILDRNFRWSHLEIDIIAKSNDQLIFAEVKTRTTALFGEPYLAVSRAKQKQLIRAANAYIQQKKLESEVRFDVFSIIMNSKETKVDHIEEAFHP
jgi:putative endonuclease